MLKDEERVCIEALRGKGEYYLGFYDKDSKEYNTLVSLFNKFDIAYYEYGMKILGVPMLPKKPMDAYIAGGMANGIAGLGAGVGAFMDAKGKEEKFPKFIIVSLVVALITFFCLKANENVVAGPVMLFIIALLFFVATFCFCMAFFTKKDEVDRH